MKAVTLHELETFLASLADEYDVRVPVRLLDGTRLLGRPEEGTLAIGPLPRKSVEVFFPQQGLVFTATGAGEMQTEAPPARPLFVLGFTAADLEGLAFTDRFFATGFRDPLYCDQREKAVIAGIAGNCGRNGEFLPIAGGDCDLELIAEADNILIAAYTETGWALRARMAGEEREISLSALQQQSTPWFAESRALLRQGSALLLADQVPDSFWAEIGERCIACTTCNLVCPTCTCFGVEDRCWPERTERSRMWDSCQLDGFMREASGHNPLGTQALRTRRRIHHKLAADVTRWGQITCVACGRCDIACPTGIGIFSVVREMVERFGGK
jgi:formate hydrogenlyase subunit 6/NADH:ubiquinone oxidoreductase subunit I